MKDIIVVSHDTHILNPGNYSYPFSYPLRPNLPGVAFFHRETEAADPKWRASGRKNIVHGDVEYKLKVYVEQNGTAFARDLYAKQCITVNPAFDWNTMRPATGAKTGQVMMCCCIPRGAVTLNASFDRSAYMAGEVAQIRAGIKNESEQDVKAMRVKLMRFITLRSSSGQVHTQTDTMCHAAYPGVEHHSEAMRDLPLSLVTNAGAILPGTKARLVDISYRFDVECDLACAPDIEVQVPVVIFAPQPPAWGLAALGIAVPQGISFNFPVAPVQQQQQMMAMAPAAQMPVMQQMQNQMQMPPMAIQQPMADSNSPHLNLAFAPAAQVQQQPQQGGYPPQMQQGGYPPQMQQGGYPPQMQQGGYPPQMQQGGYPPQMQQGGYPPQMQQEGYPPQPQQGGYPPQM